MIDLKDEYIRNYVFDPELLQRKHSIDMHKDRLENIQKANKRYLRKFHSVEIDKPMTDEEIAAKFKNTVVDDEVYSFCTVNINHGEVHKIPNEWIMSISPWKCNENTCKTFMFSQHEKSCFTFLLLINKAKRGISRLASDYKWRHGGFLKLFKNLLSFLFLDFLILYLQQFKNK